MKQLFRLAILAMLVAFSSCSSQKGAVSGVSRGKFTGKWVIGSIKYDGLIENAVQNVFDQAPPSAFRGSVWELTNSGNGIYTLNNGASQTIYWSINNNGTQGQVFQFKKIYQVDKAKNVTEGYQLQVVSNDGSDMVLKSPVTLGSQTAYIIYSFTKQ